MRNNRNSVWPKVGVGCLLAIALAAWGLSSIFTPRPSPEEKLGWVSATGHLWPGVTVYLGGPELQGQFKPLGTFSRFDDAGNAFLRQPDGSENEISHATQISPSGASYYWVRKDDPALAGH